MSIRIGINGFGRMGRLALRAAWADTYMEFVHINDPAGHAVRVPLANASLTDCVFDEVERATGVAEVNALLKTAAESGTTTSGAT